MAPDSRRPTPTGEVILQRLHSLSLSMAEIERRTPLTKNTITNAIYGPRQPQRKTIEILAQALDLPIEDLTRPQPRRHTPGPPARFASWLWQGGRLSLIIGLVGTIGAAALLLQHISPTGEGSSALTQQIHGLQFVVILLLLTRLPRPWVAPPGHWVGPTSAASPNESAEVAVPSPLAAAAASDFRRYWGAAWSFWLFLYLGLLSAALLGLLPSSEVPTTVATRWLVVGLNLVQNGATVLLLLGYEVLARPTIEADLSRKQLLPTEAWWAFALLLPLLEGGVLMLGMPWASQQAFGWVSGFAQGTALALMVGRLDSKYIEPPTLVVALLYVYAAIQGAWPVFQWHQGLMLVLTVLALMLKCLLFLFIAWLFESRVLLFYLEKVRQLDAGVRQEREQYLSELS